MGKLRARSEDEFNQRYKDILVAASELFMKNNYDDLSLASIAKALSLSRPALYSYFHSKEALFLELSKQEYLTVSDELKKNFTHKTEVDAFCNKLIKIFLDHPYF